MKNQVYLVGDIEYSIWVANLNYNDVDWFGRRISNSMGEDLRNLLLRNLLNKIVDRSRNDRARSP